MDGYTAQSFSGGLDVSWTRPLTRFPLINWLDPFWHCKSVGMNTQFPHFKTLFASSVFVLALQGCAPSSNLNGATPSNGQTAASQSGVLFTNLAAGQEVADQQALAEPDLYLRNRYVEVDRSVLAGIIAKSSQAIGETVHLNLFEDVEVDFMVEKFEQLGPDNVVLQGRIKGDAESSVTLVQNGDVLVGNVQRGDADDSYEIRVVEDKVLAIRSLNPAIESHCEATDGTEGSMVANEEENDDMSAAEMAPIPMSNPVIDVLVAYTPNAKSRMGGKAGMEALIQMGVADTNRAFSDSGVGATVRLAGIMEVSKNETSFHSDLSRLKGRNDGKWDEIHRERARVGADQVSLVGSYGGNRSGTAGTGFVRSNSDTAFTVTRASAFSHITNGTPLLNPLTGIP